MKHLAMALVLVWTCKTFVGFPALNEFRNQLDHERNERASITVLNPATLPTCLTCDISQLVFVTLEYQGTCQEAAENQCGELPAKCQR